MCGKNKEAAAITYGENGETITPSCANKDGCSGKCKIAQAAQKLAENGSDTSGFTTTLYPTLVINGKEKPFQLVFTG